MRPLVLSLAVVWMTACPAGSDDDDVGSAACAEVTAGDDWAWSGSCIGMTMGCAIVRDRCALTITCSGMDMGLPQSATVDGSAIVFADGTAVTGCQGTVDDANTLFGTCDGDCSWTLER